MPTSKRQLPLLDCCLALAWSTWAELGVAGWTRSHEDWAIDPEPLILFTAALADTDPRLRDEATDWCIHNWRFVSKVRLRNLLRDEPDEIRASFGELSATVNEHAGVVWPGATNVRPYKVTGRSSAPQLGRASMAWLRMRAMFGLGARTEILRHFLSGHEGASSVAGLAESTGYMKRNVAEESETLERAGLLAVHSVRNRFYYSLDREKELRAFVGALPSITPNWIALFRVARELARHDVQSGQLSQHALAVEAHRILRDLGDDLDALGLDGPEPRPGTAIIPGFQEWAHEVLSSWAEGGWPLQGSALLPSAAPTRGDGPGVAAGRGGGAR